MKIDKAGLDFIKSFEGFSAKACKCDASEKYYTIGYGHYGKDVKKDDTITKSKAEKLLVSDIESAENSVNKLGLKLKQGSFNALVSFTYNCGSGNLNKLCKGRTLKEISEHIISYNKCNGKILTGLTRRRLAEQELIKNDLASGVKYYKKCDANCNSIVTALKSIGVNSTYTNRKKIAIANGIKNYSGLGSQNTTMLILLKKGKLIKI